MFFCAKKIVYLSLYDKGEKIRSAGFAGIYGERQEVRISVRIKGADRLSGEDVPVCLIVNQQEIRIGKMKLTAGCGSFERKFDLREEKMKLGSRSVGAEEIMAVRIISGPEKVIEGRLEGRETTREGEVRQERVAAEAGTEEAGKEKKGEKQGEKKREQKEEKKEERKEDSKGDRKEVKRAHELEALQKQEEAGVIYRERYSGNKWDQLRSQYKKVHPFGDDREFVSIELKDFVVLGERYQKLINNSFLLHGFYNYRHLILGKDRRIGADTETCFYLGVPGVFFEREKMVAIMFGFEGFECAGPVEIGKFGYYLRSVEI